MNSIFFPIYKYIKKYCKFLDKIISWNPLIVNSLKVQFPSVCVRNERQRRHQFRGRSGIAWKRNDSLCIRRNITSSFASNVARYHRNEALAARNLAKLTTRLKRASIFTSRYSIQRTLVSLPIIISVMSNIVAYSNFPFNFHSSIRGVWLFQCSRRYINQSGNKKEKKTVERREREKMGWSGLKSGAAKSREFDETTRPSSVLREKSPSSVWLKESPYFPISTATLLKSFRKPLDITSSVQTR